MMANLAKWLGFRVSSDQYQLQQRAQVLWVVISLSMLVILPLPWFFKVPLTETLSIFSLLLVAYVLVQLERTALAYLFVIVAHLMTYLVAPSPANIFFFLLAGMMAVISLPFRAAVLAVSLMLGFTALMVTESWMLPENLLLGLLGLFVLTFAWVYHRNLASWGRAHRAMGNSRAELSMLIGSLESEIDRRAEIEQDLVYREHMLSAVLDNIEEAVIVCDQNEHVVSSNEVANHLLFGNRSPQRTTLAGEILNGSEDRKLYESMWASLQRDITISGEVLECRRSNGRPFTALLNMRSVQVDNNRVVMIIVRDISRDQKLDQMQSEFVSAVSHELRTPLTSLRGAIGLLRNTDPELIREKMQGLLEIADQNAILLSELVNDILDLTKLESGKVRFQLESFDLVSYLQQVTEENRPLEKTFNIRFRLDAKHSRFEVVNDPLRLKQVLNNLLVNAAKFSHAGGLVILSMEAEGRDALVLSVSDTGIGIPLAFQDQIFERFSQARYQENHKVAGTGLGLNICKAIIEQMGGKIWFESVPDQGATFYISLPTRVEITR